MTAHACIGEPISWLRLETFAIGGNRDAAIAKHVAECAACARCLDEIRATSAGGDHAIELPRLVIPVPPSR